MAVAARAEPYRSGALIAGKYRLAERLGVGAMGTVWSAVNVDTHGRVALKLIERPEAELRHRLLREARACACIQHKNVVQVFDVGQTTSDDPFLIMELLCGETLESFLSRKRSLAPADAAAIARDVARGLAAAHAQGVVHRDLKPANVFLHDQPGEDAPVVKLLDFGVSKCLTTPDGLRTVVGAAIGSPAYMSPEQAAGRADVDFRTDLWSLGALLYEMLTGERVFNGDAGQVLGEIAKGGPIPRVSQRVRRVDRDLDELVAACLTRDRDLRIASAVEIAGRLDARLAGGFAEPRASVPAAAGPAVEAGAAAVRPGELLRAQAAIASGTRPRTSEEERDLAPDEQDDLTIRLETGPGRLEPLPAPLPGLPPAPPLESAPPVSDRAAFAGPATPGTSVLTGSEWPGATAPVPPPLPAETRPGPPPLPEMPDVDGIQSVQAPAWPEVPAHVDTAHGVGGAVWMEGPPPVDMAHAVGGAPWPKVPAHVDTAHGVGGAVWAEQSPPVDMGHAAGGAVWAEGPPPVAEMQPAARSMWPDGHPLAATVPLDGLATAGGRAPEPSAPAPARGAERSAHPAITAPSALEQTWSSRRILHLVLALALLWIALVCAAVLLLHRRSPQGAGEAPEPPLDGEGPATPPAPVHTGTPAPAGEAPPERARSRPAEIPPVSSALGGNSVPPGATPAGNPAPAKTTTPSKPAPVTTTPSKPASSGLPHGHSPKPPSTAPQGKPASGAKGRKPCPSKFGIGCKD